MRRAIAACTTALLMIAALVAVPIAAEAAPAKTGTATVRIITPKNVPANLVLRRAHAAPLTAVKPGPGASTTVRLRVAPGTYALSVPTHVYRGVAYGGKSSVSRVTIKAGKSSSVTVRLTALPGSKSFSATDIGTTTADLNWSAPKGSTVSLRRSSGGTAPKSRTQGTRVAVRGHTAHVTGLKAGAAYSYALFTKVKGKWTGPLTLRSRTLSTSASSTAAYVAAPGTVFASKSQIAKTAVSGENLSVQLTATATIPSAGAGMVVPVSPSLPGGYLGIVTGVASDGRTLQLRPAGLADVFQQYQLNTGDPTLGTPADPAHGQPQSKGQSTSKGQSSKPLSDPSSGEKHQKLGCTVGGDADVEFDRSLTFHRVVDMTIDKGKVNYNLGFSATAAGSLSVSSNAVASCNATLFEGTQQVSVDPVPLLVKWDISGSVEVSRGINVTSIGATATGGFGAKGTLGAGGFNAVPYTIKSASVLSPTSTTSDESSVELKVGGSVAFGIGAGNSGLGALVGLKGELYPLDAKASFTQPQSGNSGLCAKVEVGMSWKASLDAEAWFGPKGWWGSFEATATKKLAGGTFSYVPTFYAPNACNVSPGGGGGTPTQPDPPTGPTPPTDLRSIQSASTSSDLNCTLVTNEDTASEYYGGSACGTFLAVGGTLFGPARIPAGDSPLSAVHPTEAWTPVSQTDSGSGTTADPNRTVTTVAAGTTGIQLVETDTWIDGGTTVATRMVIQNTGDTALPVRLSHAFDCFTADDDTGTGGIDLAQRTVGCVHINDVNAAVLSLRLQAVTAGATITEGPYSQVWSDVGAQTDLDDQAVTDGDYDNGEAVSWAMTVDGGATSSFDALTLLAGPM